MKDKEWKCPECGRMHPAWHASCWWCHPVDNPTPTGAEQNSDFMALMDAAEPH